MKALQVAAAIAEAGFSIVEMDLWNVAARHERVPFVWLKASMIGDTWEYRAFHETGTYAITPRSLPELIELLTQSYGADAAARRVRGGS